MRILKILIPLLLLIVSFSASAYKQEYGTFNNWDSYYLVTNSGEQVCAARGFFNGGYKVIFNYLVERNGDSYLNLNIENPSWSIPPGEKYVGVSVYDRNANLIYNGKGLFNNKSGVNVSQASITLFDVDVISYVEAGFTLTIDTGNRTLSFDIGTIDVNHAVHQFRQCVSDKFTIKRPSEVIQQISPSTQF